MRILVYLIKREIMGESINKNLFIGQMKCLPSKKRQAEAESVFTQYDLNSSQVLFQFLALQSPAQYQPATYNSLNRNDFNYEMLLILTSPANCLIKYN